MQKKMKRIGTIILLAVFMMLVTSAPSYAAFEWKTSELKAPEWDIPFFGKMKAPEGFSAVEVKDFRKLVDDEKKKKSTAKVLKTTDTKTTEAKPATTSFIPKETPAALKDVLPADEAAATKRFLDADLAFYHLTMNDGEAIHMAWFFAARDGEKLPPTMDFFTKDLDPAQTELLAELKKWVDANMEKAQYTDPKNKVSLKLLEMMPLQPLPAQNGQKVWTAGGRVLVTVDDMPFAFFARIYAFDVEGRLALGVLAGFDGERPFWDPVIRNMLIGEREKPVAK